MDRNRGGGDPWSDRPRDSFNPADFQYSQYNYDQQGPDARYRERDRHGGQWNGGPGQSQQQPRYEPPRQPPPPPGQPPRRTVEFSPIMEGEYRSFLDQLVESTRRCSDSESRIEELMKVKKEMLSPVFEDYCENLRRIDAYFSDAQDTYFRYRNQVQTFNCVMNNIDYYARHGFLPFRQIREDVEDRHVFVELRKSSQQDYLGKLEGLLGAARIVIDNTWANFQKERENQMPRTSKSTQGSVVIEEIDVEIEEEPEEVNVERRAPQVVVAPDEVAELKHKMSEMQLQMDQILEILQKPQNVVVVQAEAPAEVKVPAKMKAPTEMKPYNQEADEHQSENGRGRRGQENDHYENVHDSEPTRGETPRNGHHHRDRSYDFVDDGRMTGDDLEDRRFGQSSNDQHVQSVPPSSQDRQEENRTRDIWSALGVTVDKNSEKSRARGESSRNVNHHRDWSDELEKEEGSRYDGRGYDDGSRRRDQEDGQDPYDDQYDMPRTTEVDRRDYDSRHHGYENSRERPLSHGSRRTQSPRGRHQDERAHDDSGHRDGTVHHEYDRHTDRGQSPVRSSYSRNDGWSPEHRHHNAGSRNEYNGRNDGRGSSRNYEDYRGTSQDQRDFSRQPSRSHSRAYSPEGRATYYGAMDGDIPGGPSSSNGPSKKHQQNSRGKQQEGSKARRQRKPEGIVCYRCKKPGHHKNQCVEIKCTRCGGFGHAEDVCTSKTGRN